MTTTSSAATERHAPTPKNKEERDARIEALRAQMDEIPAMLCGALLANRNRTRRKDGSVRVSSEHYTFQYYGADGKRLCKRIPNQAKATVERLVRAGERYRALEREYVAGVTESTLAGGGKKNG